MIRKICQDEKYIPILGGSIGGLSGLVVGNVTGFFFGEIIESAAGAIVGGIVGTAVGLTSSIFYLISFVKLEPSSGISDLFWIPAFQILGGGVFGSHIAKQLGSYGGQMRNKLIRKIFLGIRQKLSKNEQETIINSDQDEEFEILNIEKKEQTDQEFKSIDVEKKELIDEDFE